jgi:hypothetical protein
MKRIIRAFSLDYPFISRTKSYHKAINEFPLSFSSSFEIPEDLPTFEEFEDDQEGLAKMYETYLHSLISSDTAGLDTLVEHNMVYRQVLL